MVAMDLTDVSILSCIVLLVLRIMELGCCNMKVCRQQIAESQNGMVRISYVP